MFCMRCGSQIKSGQRFCAKCGVKLAGDGPVPEMDLMSGRLEKPRRGEFSHACDTLTTYLSESIERPWDTTPHFANVLPLSGKEVRRTYESVRIELMIIVNPRLYGTNSSDPFQITWRRDVPKMLLTDESIIFLDGKNLARSWKELLKRQFEMVEYSDEYGRRVKKLHYVQSPHPRLRGPGPDPVYFSKFWTFRQSVNERLYDEFRRNPSTYTIPRSVWWVRGYRDWMWITSVDHTEGHSYLQLRLARVQMMAQMSSVDKPTWQDEAIARIFLKDNDQAKDLMCYMDNVARPELGPPFSSEYMAALPVRRPSAFAVRMFYAVCVVIVAAMVLAVLLGAGAPVWVDIPHCFWVPVSLLSVFFADGKGAWNCDRKSASSSAGTGTW